MYRMTDGNSVVQVALCGTPANAPNGTLLNYKAGSVDAVSNTHWMLSTADGTTSGTKHTMPICPQYIEK